MFKITILNSWNLEFVSTLYFLSEQKIGAISPMSSAITGRIPYSPKLY